MKFICLLALALSGPLVRSETTYFTAYTRDVRTGYMYTSDKNVEFEGKSAIESNSVWVNTTMIGGVSTKSKVESTSWATSDNRPIREVSAVESGSQTVKTVTVYGEKSAEVDIDTGGQKVHRSIPFPDGPICGDMMKLIHEKAPKAGDKVTAWTLSDMEFEKVDLQTVGPTTFVQGGKSITGNLTIAKFATGSDLRIYLDDAGSLLREEFPMEMVLTADTKEAALAELPKDLVLPDMIDVSLLRLDGTIEDPLHLKTMRLQVTGMDLSKAPSDSNQTIEKDGEGWIVDVHPARLADSVPTTIEQAALGNERWTAPGLYLNADDPKIRELAAKLVRRSKNVKSAALEIRKYVNKSMKPEMVVGLPRSATEILNDKRGKCTDYAILTATLLRAAGIPGRVCAGLIAGDGALYYHAWDEFWDGKRWVEIDSVFDDGDFSAFHVKLSQGDVQEGFGLTYADPKKVRIRVID